MNPDNYAIYPWIDFDSVKIKRSNEKIISMDSGRLDYHILSF